ncbi:MAG TPA: hypothetical protein VFV99_19920 [Kofleriaceae bacterium]|nr:hypothetical protein [Kofleriaceae bacterium]
MSITGIERELWLLALCYRARLPLPMLVVQRCLDQMTCSTRARARA